jgi:hypothetical protein
MDGRPTSEHNFANVGDISFRIPGYGWERQLRQGRAWSDLPWSRKVARKGGNGRADSLPSGLGNLNVYLRRQRSSNLTRRRIQSHAIPSLPQFPANREKTGNIAFQSAHSGDKSIRGTTLPGKTAFLRWIRTGNEQGMCTEREFPITGSLAI